MEITNNLERRLLEHGTVLSPIVKGLTRTEVRAVEQALIEHHGLIKDGGTLTNKINSISTANSIYPDAKAFGETLLHSLHDFRQMAPKRVGIRDIAEIKAPKGRAYVQYVHDGRDMGELVHVLPGVFSTPPTDFAALVEKRELYFTFYTMNHALRAGQTEIVSNQPVPNWARCEP